MSYLIDVSRDVSLDLTDRDFNAAANGTPTIVRFDEAEPKRTYSLFMDNRVLVVRVTINGQSHFVLLPSKMTDDDAKTIAVDTLKAAGIDD